MLGEMCGADRGVMGISIGSGRGPHQANAPRVRGRTRLFAANRQSGLSGSGGHPPHSSAVCGGRPITFTIISARLGAISIIEYNIKIANLTAIIARCSYGQCPYISFIINYIIP